MTYLAPAAVAVSVLVLLGLGVTGEVLTRLVVAMYPKGHKRRKEILGERDHYRSVAKLPDRMIWLGGEVVAGLVDGVIPRVVRRRRLRATPQPQCNAGIKATFLLMAVYGATAGLGAALAFLFSGALLGSSPGVRIIVAGLLLLSLPRVWVAAIRKRVERA